MDKPIFWGLALMLGIALCLAAYGSVGGFTGIELEPVTIEEKEIWMCGCGDYNQNQKKCKFCGGESYREVESD